MRRNNLLFPFLLIIIWVVILVIVHPVGNFPLNDDWQYARPVYYLINKGYYLSTDSYSPIIMAQALWGSLFCLPFGFSFTALRVSTLVLSLAGLLVFYFLLLKASKNPRLSFLGALLLCANPLYIVLSNSFMTDVPFITFSIFSVYFFFCSIESNKNWHIVVATIFAMIAVLIRQYGLIIPVAYAVAAIVKNRPKFSPFLKIILPAIITALTLEVGFLWLKHIGSEMNPYRGDSIMELLSNPQVIYTHAIEMGSSILECVGFFLFPLLAYTTWSCILSLTKRQRIVVFLCVLICIPKLIIWAKAFLYGNMMHTYGIAPRTLKGMFDIVYPNPEFPIKLLYVLQALAFVGAVMLLINLGKITVDIFCACIKRDFTKALFKQTLMFLLWIGLAFLVFLPNFFFDRYTLPFVPFAIILILTGINENYKVKTPIYVFWCAATVTLGFVGAAASHDYFSWNRSRWQAIDYLTKDLKASPHQMDGGYEYNGWVLDRNFPPNPKSPKRSWWSVDDDEYAVTFHNFDGYTIIKQFPYQSYLPCRVDSIYVIHRK